MRRMDPISVQMARTLDKANHSMLFVIRACGTEAEQARIWRKWEKVRNDMIKMVEMAQVRREAKCE